MPQDSGRRGSRAAPKQSIAIDADDIEGHRLDSLYISPVSLRLINGKQTIRLVTRTLGSQVNYLPSIFDSEGPDGFGIAYKIGTDTHAKRRHNRHTGCRHRHLVLLGGNKRFPFSLLLVTTILSTSGITVHPSTGNILMVH
jgi:hypothetical protein